MNIRGHMIEEDFKLIEPTLEDFRKEFPKPEICTRDYNVNHGWIAPNGEFFTCPYAGHTVWAETVMEYWPELVEENKALYTVVIPYEVKSLGFKQKYGQDMPPDDYMISQGWLKWMFRQTHHEIVKGGQDMTRRQWEKIGFLNVHSTTNTYKIIIVETI